MQTTFPRLLLQHAQQRPTAPAMREKEYGIWQTLTWADLAAMVQDLARREINEVHVEAGSKLGGSLMRAGLIDELLIYLAPVLLGPGQGLLALPALSQLSDGIALQFTDCQRIGPDLRVMARRVGADAF